MQIEMSMKRIIVFGAVGVWIVISLSARQISDAPEERLQSFLRNIHTFNHLYPQEKVYLHFDNNAYFQGDTIWFAAYVVSAETLQPADLSRVLYVELLSEEGELVSTQRLEIKDGRCHGQIALCREMDRLGLTKQYQYTFYPINPRTNNYILNLPSGYYEVRAYTRNMLNWGTDVCFSRVLPVFDVPNQEGCYFPDGTQTTPTSLMKNKGKEFAHIREEQRKNSSVHIDFYPEGGQIVRGLPSRVAFKVTDERGGALKAEGCLCRNKEPIVNINTIHDGMGSFNFIPQEGTYSLNLTVEGKRYDFDLPDFEEQGVSLLVKTVKRDSLQIAVSYSTELQSKELGISIVCRGRPVYFKSLPVLRKEKVRYLLPNIPMKKLPPGVNLLTIFDTDGRIYAERKFFVYDSQRPDSVSWSIVEGHCNPFGLISVKLHYGFSDDEKRPAVVLLSIQDKSAYVKTNNNVGLQTYMLLTSDLKGYIHQPEFYFAADDSLHRQALDLLMLTQGWNRYDWRNMAGVTPFRQDHFVEKGLSVEGQIKHPKKEYFLEKIKVAMSIGEKNRVDQWGSCITDEEGRFFFLLEPFTGRWSMHLSLFGNKNKGEAGRILLHREFSPVPRPFNWLEKEMMMPAPLMDKNSFSFTGVNQLREVTVHKGRRRMLKFDFINMRDMREKALDRGEKIRSRMTIKDFIEDLYGTFSYPIFWGGGARYKRWLKSGRSVLQDYPSGDIFNAEDTSIDDIDYIIVYDSPYAHQKINWRKDISVKVLEEKRKTILFWAYNRKYFPGNRTTYIDGYSYVADYYHPRYNREMIPGEVDYRRTLYWNPALCLDEKGEATVTFYNNSVCEEMVVSCEGL